MVSIKQADCQSARQGLCLAGHTHHSQHATASLENYSVIACVPKGRMSKRNNDPDTVGDKLVRRFFAPKQNHVCGHELLHPMCYRAHRLFARVPSQNPRGSLSHIRVRGDEGTLRTFINEGM